MINNRSRDNNNNNLNIKCLYGDATRTGCLYCPNLSAVEYLSLCSCIGNIQHEILHETETWGLNGPTLTRVLVR